MIRTSAAADATNHTTPGLLSAGFLINSLNNATQAVVQMPPPGIYIKCSKWSHLVAMVHTERYKC